MVEQTVRRREESRSELFAQQGLMLRKLSDVILGKSAAASADKEKDKDKEESTAELMQRVVGIEQTPEDAAWSTHRQLAHFVRKQRSLLSLHQACLHQLEMHLGDLACVDYGSILGQKVVVPLLTAKLHQLAEEFHEKQVR